MATQRRIQFIYGQAAWLLTAFFALLLLDAFSFELLFVVSFIGFLAITQLTAQFTITSAWRRRLKWPILVGLLIFIAIVIRRILAILPPGVL
ncbi:hypothetical protein [Halorussus salinus]|uniref:hypothetical protein n=1 Tax=Halorussus salinus TaxID=1364935 RepID=UPI0010923614|nr:hypothetical protein [Halorussus salinus]